MSFEVRFAAAAEDDLIRLFEFLLEHAQTTEDLDRAQQAIDAIESAALHHLASTPYSFRKTGKSPTRRELIIPFDATGYVALFEIFEIASASIVLVLAVRHQREEDYH